jgi:hypothetical protein
MMTLRQYRFEPLGISAEDKLPGRGDSSLLVGFWRVLDPNYDKANQGDT